MAFILCALNIDWHDSLAGIRPSRRTGCDHQWQLVSPMKQPIAGGFRDDCA